LADYREICRGFLNPHNVDLYTTLSAYNFSFWFNGRTGLIVLDDRGEEIALVDIASKEYRIYSMRETDCVESFERLSWSLGLDEDLSEFYRIALNDPLLSNFVKEYPGFRVRATSLWWALVIGVCQQNASFKQGWKMLYNIVVNYNRKIRVGGHEVFLPPTPEDVLRNPDLLLKSRVGYRATYILEAARQLVRGEIDVEHLKRLSPTEAESVLKEIRGVGSYTARLALVLAAKKYELPPIDRWLRKVASVAYSVPEEEVEKVWRTRWSSYSGLASILTTIALDAVTISKALERLKQGLLTPVLDKDLTPLTLWRYL